MTSRVRDPAGLTTGIVGRTYVIHYFAPIVLDLAKQAQEDYERWVNEELEGQPAPLLMMVDRPFPLAPMDCRVYWRQVAQQPPGWEGISLIIGGVVGLMAATVTHFGEQLVAVLGVRFRTFRNDYEACCWLCDNFDTGTDPDTLADYVEQLRSETADVDAVE